MTVKGAWTPQKVRDRIQTGVIVKRLTDHMLGKLELSSTQLKAAEILLKKSLPDLASIENTHSGPNGQPIQISATDAKL